MPADTVEINNSSQVAQPFLCFLINCIGGTNIPRWIVIVNNKGTDTHYHLVMLIHILACTFLAKTNKAEHTPVPVPLVPNRTSQTKPNNDE